ncbi:MAG: hypothetical protein WAN65_19845, partial [Candidatus Sulfotelmatobacter sp.]
QQNAKKDQTSTAWMTSTGNSFGARHDTESSLSASASEEENEFMAFIVSSLSTACEQITKGPPSGYLGFCCRAGCINCPDSARVRQVQLPDGLLHRNCSQTGLWEVAAE